MIITSTEAQNNFGRFLNLVNEEDIIITKNGKKVARLVKYFEYDNVQEESSNYNYEGMEVSYQHFLKIVRESENRYEYIDGRIYLQASPKVKHQKIIMNLSTTFFEWFRGKDCLPLNAPLDVTLYKEDKPNVIQPDILVICDQENINEDDTYVGIPSLVVEVLSKTTQSKDIIKKLDLYMSGGVGEYWIVNPFSEEVNIYLFEDKEVEKLITFKKGEIARSLVFQGLVVDLTEVFSL
ncbi:MAG: type II toxin-antitoxin system prevent-host-death family antitoxin [Halanaerobiaceae bacterium]